MSQQSPQNNAFLLHSAIFHWTMLSLSMNKTLSPYIYTTENNLEIARTSRDTGKTLLINYVIGNNKKKEEIFEKKQQSLEYTEKSRRQSLWRQKGEWITKLFINPKEKSFSSKTV